MPRLTCLLALLALASSAAAQGGHCPLTGKSFGKAKSSAPALEVRWRDVTSLTGAVTTGKTVDADSPRLARRPMMVYIYREGDEEAPGSGFKQEKVACTSRFFDCLRIEQRNAERDTALREDAAKAPRIVFLRPTFEAVTALRPGASARKLFSAMRATLKKDYTNSVPAALRKLKALRKEFLALDREKDKLALLDQRIESCNSEGKRERLAEERDELAGALAERENDLKSRDEAIFVLKRKDDDPGREPAN